MYSRVLYLRSPVNSHAVRTAPDARPKPRANVLIGIIYENNFFLPLNVSFREKNVDQKSNLAARKYHGITLKKFVAQTNTRY